MELPLKEIMFEYVPTTQEVERLLWALYQWH